MGKGHDHLVGVIPVAGFEGDFGFPWHDCLQPIAQNYLAIERSVVECAYAGADTIWIVCNDDMQPLIRHRIGEYVQDPVWLYRPFDRNEFENQKPIPIFYVPIHPKYRDKIDCYGWSVMQGALMAWWVAHRISKWAVPKKYYVSYPYGVYDPKLLRPHRRDISGKDLFYLSCEGKTFKDGEYLGFSFREEDYKTILKTMKSGTGMFDPATYVYNENYDRLPLEERNSARNFSLDKVYESVTMGGAKEVELPWYYRIDSWDNLTNFLGSEEANLLARPSKKMLYYRELNPIGIDDEEE